MGQTVGQLKKWAMSIVFLLISVVIISCAHNEPVNPVSAPEPVSTPVVADGNDDKEKLEPGTDSSNDTLIASDQESENAFIAEGGGKSAYSGDYVIGPEDLLEINVFEAEELNKTLRVSSSGFIKLPLAGKVKAAGLTVSELEAEVSSKLEQYFHEPLVSIFLKEYRSQSITILGAIQSPQVYIVTRQKFLLDIISIAGGLTKDAGDICYVRRGSGTIIIRLDDLINNGDHELNIPVFSGDIVHVPIGGVVFVDGSVRSPGSFGMRGSLTLTQLIAMARGFQYEAVRDKLTVYRDSGKPTREIIEVDYDAILAKKSPDLVLENKDIVIVPTSGAKKLWKGIVQSLSGATTVGDFRVGAGIW